MSQQTQTTSPYVAFTRTCHCFKKALDVAKTTDILIGRKRKSVLFTKHCKTLHQQRTVPVLTVPMENLQSYMQHNSSRNGNSDAQSSFVS